MWRLILFSWMCAVLRPTGVRTGALNVPHRQITAERVSLWPIEILFVVYCAGPHCNGADRAALRLAELGRHVKLMLGGMTGWADAGFNFATGDAPGSAVAPASIAPHSTGASAA